MRKLTVACTAAAGLLMATVATSSQAAPLSQPQLSQSLKSIESSSAVEQVRYGRYCRQWHWECRSRWGFGWRYRRCMARHGC